MKFTSLLIAFEEDNAPREPYFMGFTFEKKEYVFKGAFLQPEMVTIGDDQKIGWGENQRYRSVILAGLLLQDCIGKQEEPSMLVNQLSKSLQNFQRGNGIAWIIWADDLMKWINLPKYGIFPRMGYLASLENGLLTIRFPVLGTSLN